MKIFIYALLLFIMIPKLSDAQGENNNWTFYPVITNDLSLNFSSGSPQIVALPLTNSMEGFAIAVSYPNGQLRFIVRLTGNTLPAYLNNVYEANGTPIPNSQLNTGQITDACMPVVIPRPQHPDQYYIIYSYSNGLRYALLDMSLNNGHGGMIEKDMALAPYGTVVAKKMTAVKGCDGIWLVVRSRVANGYYSYHVTASGIDTSAVFSEAGNFTMYDYNFILWGFLKASQDGSRLATCGWAGIELYDFEKCSGKIKNARVLDTTGNTQLSSQNINHHTRFQDVCFSPDGSKLYTTQNYVDSSLSSYPIQAGKLFQYDLSLPSLTAMINSKTVVMVNHSSLVINPSCLCCSLPSENPLGSIKAGPDGRLYIDNGSYTCLLPQSVPAGYNPGPAFHTILYPNLQGAACQPQFNTVIVNSFTHSTGGDFNRSGDDLSYLQYDIVTAPPPPDTTIGSTYHLSTCFRPELSLSADSNGSCYLWDDNSTERERVVTSSGSYYVRYFKDCSYTTDTFYASLIKLPQLWANQACPGMHMGRLVAVVDSIENTSLNYRWKAADGGSVLRLHAGASGDTLKGIDTGRYFLQISTASGCDTTLSANILPLPKPMVHGAPADTVIHYGDSIRLTATGALLYAWQPSGSLDTATIAAPMARPVQPTIYLIVGMNGYGCLDTGYIKISIDYSMTDFVPNAFSPNGDGHNDIFRIEGITYQKIVAFRIFNRFGQQVFSTFDLTAGWDGTQNGRPCDAGAYYYFIQLEYPDGSRKTYKGDLTLIR